VGKVPAGILLPFIEELFRPTGKELGIFFEFFPGIYYTKSLYKRFKTLQSGNLPLDITEKGKRTGNFIVKTVKTSLDEKGSEMKNWSQFLL